MKTIPLNKHPRWPLVKKLRRAIARELEARLAPATEDAVDEYLRDHEAEVFAELGELIREDLAARAAPAGDGEGAPHVAA